MASYKPAFAEVYAWNEPVLSTVAIAWGVFIATFQGGFGPLTIIGGVTAAFGIALLCVQSARIRTFIDFTAPAFTATHSPKSLRSLILKMWPMSIIIRILCHFFFTWWWLVLGVSVAYGMSLVADVRFILYIGFSILHGDRLVRIVQWMRK